MEVSLPLPFTRGGAGKLPRWSSQQQARVHAYDTHCAVRPGWVVQIIGARTLTDRETLDFGVWEATE